MNRRTFVGMLCAVLTAPLWGKKAAEPAEEWFTVDAEVVKRLRESGRLVRGMEIQYVDHRHLTRGMIRFVDPKSEEWRRLSR